MKIHLKPPYSPETESTLDEALEEVRRGNISPSETLVWHEGLPEWIPLSQLISPSNSTSHDPLPPPIPARAPIESSPSSIQHQPIQKTSEVQILPHTTFSTANLINWGAYACFILIAGFLVSPSHGSRVPFWEIIAGALGSSFTLFIIPGIIHIVTKRVCPTWTTKRRFVTLYISTAIIAAMAVFGSLQGKPKSYTPASKGASEPARQLRKNTGSVDEQLAALADSFSRKVPINIDTNTTLVSATALPNRTFQMTYSWKNKAASDFFEGALRQILLPDLVKEYQTNPEMAVFRDNKVTVIFRYTDRNGELIEELRVTPDQLAK